MPLIAFADRLYSLGSKAVASYLPPGKQLTELKSLYCSVDSMPQASAVPLAFVRSMERVENMVVRCYKERFTKGWMPVQLWGSLRLLALDAGNVNNSGFVSLFAEFAVCRHVFLLLFTQASSL